MSTKFSLNKRLQLNHTAHQKRNKKLRNTALVSACVVMAAFAASELTGTTTATQTVTQSVATTVNGLVTNDNAVSTPNFTSSKPWVAVPTAADPLIDNVTPKADAAEKGMFSPVLPWAINAIHLALLPNGKVMGWGPRNDSLSAYTYDFWDTTKGTTMAAHVVRDEGGLPESFCGSATLLQDGKLLISEGGNGGQSSSRDTTLYDPVADKRNVVPAQFADDRWYASMIKLPDGRPIILGGMDPYQEPMYGNPEGAINGGLVSMTPEVFENGKWRSLFGAKSRLAFGPDFLRAEYPRAWVAPNGKVFGVTGEQMWFLDPNANNGQGVVTDAGKFKTGINNVTRPNVGSTGTAVMYAPGKILKAGGNGYWILDGYEGSKQASIIEVGDGTAKYTDTGSMKYQRKLLNLVVLADGKVLAVGGASVGAGGGAANVMETEMWDPATAQWSTMATLSRARLYHSTAIMLPNGTLLAAGTGFPSPGFNTNGEVFYPPYLFKRNGTKVEWAKRPVVKGITGFSYEHNEPMEMELSDDSTIVSKVVLMGFSVTTHTFDTGQRYIPLEFRQTGRRISAITPNANLTPPGYYQAVVVDSNGVPSKSVIVSVGANIKAPPAPSVPYTPTELIKPINASILSAGGTATYQPELNTPSALVSWDFGDGTPATAFAPNTPVNHQFTKPGVYLVTLTTETRGIKSTSTFLQTVKTATTQYASNASTSILVDKDNVARVWTVNPDSNSVSVVDSKTQALLKEISVGLNPRSIAQAEDGKIWVVNKDSASITVINNKNFAVVNTFSLGRGTQPHGLVFAPDYSAAFVALEATGRVLRFGLNGDNDTFIASIGPRIRHISVSGDGQRVFVSRYVTPRLPGEETAQIDTSKGGAEVVVLNANNLQLIKTVLLGHSKVEDGEVGGRGIPNYLGAVAISPDGLNAFVPSKMDNVLRGVARDGQSLNFQSTVRAVSSKIDVTQLSEVLASRIDHDNSSVASAAAYHSSGAYLFVALETSREVAVINAFTGGQLFRIPVGLAPQGLALSADGTALYVQNFMERSMTLVDISALVNNGQSQYKVINTVKTVNKELLSPVVLRGKQLFYDAADTRLTRDKYMSCAACHNDGMDDGRVWDLTGFGEGLRNTIDLRGHAATAQGGLHWSSNFDEVQDFEMQIRSLAGGTGLMDDAVLNVGTRKAPLGDKKAGLSTDLDALAAYVASLSKTNVSPFRAAGQLTVAAEAGRDVFAENCAGCHGGTQFTLSGNNQLVNMGTLKPTSGKRLAAVLEGIDPPSLKGVWQTAPYLHDGSAATLADAIRAHTAIQSVSGLSNSNLTNVVEYLKQIEDDEIPHWPSYIFSKPSTSLNSVGLLGSSLTVGANAYKVGDQIKGNYTLPKASNYPGAWVGIFRKVPWVDERRFGVWANANSGSYAVNTAGWPAGEYYVALFAQGDQAKMLTAPVEVGVYTNAVSPMALKGSVIATSPDLSTGLRASYYDNNNFQSTPVLVRNEAVGFDWGVGAPNSIVPADNFSVRWEGELIAPETGSFQLQTRSDDRVRVWVNDQLMIDRWNANGDATLTANAMNLVVGQAYRIRMDYIEYGGNATAELRWKRPLSTVFETVPVTQLRSRSAAAAVGKGSGKGLLGNYFTNNALSGTASYQRIDDTLDYEWQYSNPLFNMPWDNYSIRWTGFIEAPVSGEYTFRTFSDDGIRMWFDNKQVINNWTAHWPTWNYSTKVVLKAGQKYPVTIEYNEYGAVASMKMQWQTPSDNVFSSIPRDRLYVK